VALRSRRPRPSGRRWARRHLEEHVGRADDLAAAVVELAAGDDRAKLLRALAAYHAEADGIEIAAVQYFTATADAARLTGRPGADVAPPAVSLRTAGRLSEPRPSAASSPTAGGRPARPPSPTRRVS
jgi:hypothetical protein